MKKATGIVIGILLILFGAVYLLNSLGIADIDLTFEGWWTLFIIVPCLNGLITRPEKLGYAIGLVFGVLLLLAAQGIITYDFIVTLIIPALAIGFGIKLIVTSAKMR
ncbi:MAG: hypothetical protein J5590_02000 [Clostridia bacterium]|nr:hypothetical protein [Clostridia bacterium]